MDKVDIVKVKIPSNQLFKATSSLSSLISNNPVIPILRNFLFQVTSKELTITGADPYTFVVTKVPIQATGEISIAIPAAILVDTLRNIVEQPIELHIDQSNYSTTIITANGRYRIACENDVDFPKIPQNQEGKSIKLPVKQLKKALKSTFFAASKDEGHPSICGVNFIINKDGITLATTDGHRLVRLRLNIPLKSTNKNITLTSKSTQLLLQLFPEDNSNIEVSLDEKRAYFLVGNLQIITSLIDESYPAYQSIIPEKHPYELTANTRALQDALKLTDCYASKTTHEICLSASEHHLTIEAEDLEFANQGETSLQCHYEGKPMQLGVNAKLLFEMVKNIDSEKIILHLQNPQKAIVMTPVNDASDEELLMLIMPIALKRSAAREEVA